MFVCQQGFAYSIIIVIIHSSSSSNSTLYKYMHIFLDRRFLSYIPVSYPVQSIYSRFLYLNLFAPVGHITILAFYFIIIVLWLNLIPLIP